MLTREWLSAFVPIGVLRAPNDWVPIGAGVLFHDPPVVWLITAAHVVKGAKGHKVVPLVTHAKGGLVVIQLDDIQSKYGYGWHLHEKLDIAATLMPLSPDWQIKAIGEKLCIKMDELVPSMQCYTVGCPYGVRGFDPQRATPLVLDGIIAGLDTSSSTIYTSAPTFPGNSGGPIIVRRDPFNPAGGLVVGQPVLLLAGIILQASVVSAQNASGSSPLPPLHLGIGVSIEAVLQLTKSEAALKEREQTLGK